MHLCTATCAQRPHTAGDEAIEQEVDKVTQVIFAELLPITGEASGQKTSLWYTSTHQHWTSRSNLVPHNGILINDEPHDSGPLRFLVSSQPRSCCRATHSHMVMVTLVQAHTLGCCHTKAQHAQWHIVCIT